MASTTTSSRLTFACSANAAPTNTARSLSAVKSSAINDLREPTRVLRRAAPEAWSGFGNSTTRRGATVR
jgi:hypothetical protein